MIKTCPLFSICGGCVYDFASPNYRAEKIKKLDGWNLSSEPFWTDAGQRRRADFCFSGCEFGFYQRGTKNIIRVEQCPNLLPEINAVLPKLAPLPWVGTGSALVTVCDNGIDLGVVSDVPYFTREFKESVEKLPLIRVTWNGNIVMQKTQPKISFAGHTVDYIPNAFLQPTAQSESAMREFVASHIDDGARVADLFCGLGNFTFVANADGQGRDGMSKANIDGFDVVGIGAKRDLFKNPLSVKMLNTYDVIIMDPPRAGALAQTKLIAESNVKKVIYVSCNPITLRRDAKILTNAGYKITATAAFDQFVGTDHWELAVVFEK
ncbi:MAG: class I SAM-dependent RNA methyltransferase [Alphaproteobacteria bacterium]|nr:class I SAM-dependent RNA methyltransferase [Alphaproteobacteria bacterium]